MKIFSMDLFTLPGSVSKQNALSEENVFFPKCQILLQSTDKIQKGHFPRDK